MAFSINRATILGNVGKDPEIKTMQSGGKVATFSVATSQQWKDKNTGEKKERTSWHNIVVFNEGLAGIVEQHIKKGSKVYVEGSIETRSWEDQSGTKKYTTEIVLRPFNGDIVIFGASGGGRPAPSEDDYGTTKAREPAASRPSTRDELDDEIPF